MGRTASSQKRGVALTIPVELKRARDVGVNGGLRRGSASSFSEKQC